MLAVLAVGCLVLTQVDCRRTHKRRHRDRFPLNATETFTTIPSRGPFMTKLVPDRHKSAIKGSRKAVVVTKKTYLRKEWCKTQPLKQVIREKGCLRTTVLNNFCYGQCNSFFVPKSDKKDQGPAAFMSCGFCKPRHFRTILVTLRCPGKKGMRFKRKRIQGIKKCRCMAQDVSFP